MTDTTTMPTNSEWWRSPPRRGWLIALTIPLAAMLWANTYPGAHFLLMLALVYPALIVLGITWAGRFVAWRLSEHPRAAKPWLIAPAMVISTWVLTVTDVPVWTRFQFFARDDFNAVIEDLEPRGSFDNWVPLETPDRIGTYDIVATYQIGENVIFYEATGNFFDDAGFAFLPEGPDNRFSSGSFESPAFRSIGGDWYAWTASW